MLSDRDLWLSLTSAKGIGPSTVKKLYQAFGSVREIAFGPALRLESIEGLSRPAVQAVLKWRAGLSGVEPFDIHGYNVICLGEANYPVNLSNIYDPPPVIYCIGDTTIADDRAVSVVGTRYPSRYGEEMAFRLAKGLVQNGITVVSGLAVGIDAAAHRGALSGGGRTIAVLGTGIGNIYPGQNRELAVGISKQGAVVSEYPPGYRTEKYSFPRRNRLISGWSLGTIVVEGSEDSGSLITAYSALDQDRQVFAVPGQVSEKMSKAPNSLIKQGAKLVETVDDVLSELNMVFEKGREENAPLIHASELSDEENRVLSILSQNRANIDMIAHACALPVSRVSELLTGMCLSGNVRELPGGFFGPTVI